MLDKETLLLFCMELTTGTCSFCAHEQQWEPEIDKILRMEFPEVWPRAGTGIAGDHPVWVRFRELWDAHAVPVVSWEFDSAVTNICQYHWQLVGQMFSS